MFSSRVLLNQVPINIPNGHRLFVDPRGSVYFRPYLNGPTLIRVFFHGDDGDMVGACKVTVDNCKPFFGRIELSN